MQKTYHLGKTPMPQALRDRDAERRLWAQRRRGAEAQRRSAFFVPNDRTQPLVDFGEIHDDKATVSMSCDPSCVEYLRDLKPARQRDDREIGFTADDDAFNSGDEIR